MGGAERAREWARGRATFCARSTDHPQGGLGSRRTTRLGRVRLDGQPRTAATRDQSGKRYSAVQRVRSRSGLRSTPASSLTIEGRARDHSQSPRTRRAHRETPPYAASRPATSGADRLWPRRTTQPHRPQPGPATFTPSETPATTPPFGAPASTAPRAVPEPWARASPFAGLMRPTCKIARLSMHASSAAVSGLAILGSLTRVRRAPALSTTRNFPQRCQQRRRSLSSTSPR